MRKKPDKLIFGMAVQGYLRLDCSIGSLKIQSPKPMLKLQII